VSFQYPFVFIGMKRLISILITFLIVSGVNSQNLPLIEEFNSTTDWVFTNGAGVQLYFNDVDSYASFNLGNEPYLNDTSISITSPNYSFENCQTSIVVSFPISGRIENYDTLFFQYKENDVWQNRDWYTGTIDFLPDYNFNSNITQFRFVLRTDSTKLRWVKPNLTGQQLNPDEQHPIMLDISNTYVGRDADNNREIQVYYYDIANFSIDCVISLPITLLTFKGAAAVDYNELEWVTVSEINNDKFIIESSGDAINFTQIGFVDGSGTSNFKNIYYFTDLNPSLITYYKLIQKDYNGSEQAFDVIVVMRNNGGNNLKVVKIYNLTGQEVPEDYAGIKIYLFNDGSIVKKFSVVQN